MSTVQIKSVDAHNMATGYDLWTMSLEQAKRVSKEIKKAGEDRPGSYWRSRVCSPVRSAARTKRSEVTISTHGFSTSELNQFVQAAGLSTIITK